MEGGFLLYRQGAVYGSCFRAAILHWSEAWCLKDGEREIFDRAERSTVRAMLEYSSMME